MAIVNRSHASRNLCFYVATFRFSLLIHTFKVKKFRQCDMCSYLALLS